jgi:hypothetical protein
MDTGELVRTLGAELVPVERAPRVETRTLRFCVGAFGFVAACLAAHGLRRDWLTTLHEVSFLREQGALLVLFGVSVWGVFRLAVPGRSGSPLAKLGPPLALLGWVGLVLARAAGAEALGPPGWKCASRMMGLAVVPLVWLLFGLRRDPLLEPRRMLLSAVWAACSLAMFGTQWLCVRDAPLHVLVWHCGPVVLAGLAGGVLLGLYRRRF